MMDTWSDLSDTKVGLLVDQPWGSDKYNYGIDILTEICARKTKIFIVYHHIAGWQERKACADIFVVIVDMIFSPNYQKWLIGHSKLVTITSLTYIRHVLVLSKTLEHVWSVVITKINRHLHKISTKGASYFIVLNHWTVTVQLGNS